VTAADPYPYYAALVADRPLHRDDGLGLWVAASAAAVTAILGDERCRVRPTAEPVPRALMGRPAGEIFSRLVRQNDGERHASLKPAVVSRLEAFDVHRVAPVARERARALVDTLAPHRDPRHLNDFAFRLPAETVASLLGAPVDLLPSIAQWTGALVGGFAPGATADSLALADRAAGHLLDVVRSLNSDAGAMVANVAGFLVQSYDATAGLIGNTLLALARHADLRFAVPAVVLEVVRHDAPVQNTRRFVAQDGRIAGVDMRAGDAILVVPAAANRDPAVNPDPASFDVTRADARVFTFGVGPHACAGATIATTIAVAGAQALIGAGLALDGLAESVAYRPSVNARIPVFGG
jgi:cytochrome P450